MSLLLLFGGEPAPVVPYEPDAARIVYVTLDARTDYAPAPVSGVPVLSDVRVHHVRADPRTT